MIDPKLLRTDLQGVARNLARRGFTLDVAALRNARGARKQLQIEADRLRAERNSHAKAVGMAKGRGEDIAPLIAKGEALTRRARDASTRSSTRRAGGSSSAGSSSLPNLLHESVPGRRDETANVEVRRWGEPRKLRLQAARSRGARREARRLDFEAAGRISGARFVVMRGQLARLHRALAQFMLDLHTREHGYTEVYVPYLVQRDALVGTGQLPKFEQDLFSERRRARALPDSHRRSAGDEPGARPDRRAQRSCR